MGVLAATAQATASTAAVLRDTLALGVSVVVPLEAAAAVVVLWELGSWAEVRKVAALLVVA